MNNLINQKYYDDYLNALIIGNMEIATHLVSEFMSKNNNIIEFYETIVKRSMYDIGLLWEHNKISVATEHLASSITESLIIKFLYELKPIEKHTNKIILSCVENEQHQIGIKMVEDVFEQNGWNTYNLGANTPVRDIIRLAKELKTDIIALSVALYFNLPVLDRMISVIREELMDKLIIVGGQAFTKGGKEILRKFENVLYFNNLYSIDLFIKNLR